MTISSGSHVFLTILSGFILVLLILKSVEAILRNVKRKVLSSTTQLEFMDDIGSSVDVNGNDRNASISRPVVLKLPDGDVPAHTTTLSATGAFITCEDPPYLNERFDVCLYMHEEQRRVLRAEVVWTNRGFPDEKIVNRGAWVRFLDQTSDDRLFLQSLLPTHGKENKPVRGLVN